MKTSNWTTAVLRNMLMALIITQFANALIIADDRIRSLDITPAIGRGYTFMTNSFHSICLEADELTIPSFNYDFSYYEFTGSTDLEATLASEISTTFIYPKIKYQLNGATETGTGGTEEAYYVLAIMRVERYYSSIRDYETRLIEPAINLLQTGDYTGFFKACGVNYVRGIRRAQELSAMFRFVSASKSIAAEFIQLVKANRLDDSGSRAEGAKPLSSQAKFAAINSSLSIKIVAYGLSLDAEIPGKRGDEDNTLLATNLSDFKKIMEYGFHLMTRSPNAENVGLVFGLELAPWTENLDFIKASNLSDNNVIEIPLSRSLIPRSYRLDEDGRTRITNYTIDRRDEYMCKDETNHQKDKYGFCCNSDVLYDYQRREYNPENPELRICRPRRRVEPPLLKETMITNGEFIVRLDKLITDKQNQFSMLEQCVTQIRRVPETLNFKVLTPKGVVQYDSDIDFNFTALELKAALDPHNDFGVIRHFLKEVDEFTQRYYGPCIAALYGLNVSGTGTTGSQYFTLYPWYSHPECSYLACFLPNSRWDRETGTCTPGILTGPTSKGYDENDKYCLLDAEADLTRLVCKYPSTDMSLKDDMFKKCWDDLLPVGQITYLMEHFCNPVVVSNDEVSNERKVELQEIFDQSCRADSSPSTQPSISAKPSTSPQPSEQPSATQQPSVSKQPSLHPSTTSQPSEQPSATQQPSTSSQPTVLKSNVPSLHPSTSSQPTIERSENPSIQHSSAPSSKPSKLASSQPSSEPTTSQKPSMEESENSSSQPSTSQKPSMEESENSSSQPSK